MENNTLVAEKNVEELRIRRLSDRYLGRCVALARGVIVGAIILLLWEILPSAGLVEPSILPPFSKILGEWKNVIVGGLLWKHVLSSMQRSLLGLGMSVAFGLPLGIIIGYFKKAGQAILPFVNFCRQIPALALFPVFILFLGIGETSKIGIVFWVSLWPLLINTISGVNQVDPIYVKAAKSMGEKDLGILLHVILPAGIPSIMTGLRLSAASAVVALVSAEMIGAKSGLGFLVVNSQYNFQIARMYVAILSIATIGTITNYGLERLQRRLTFWAN